MFGTVVVAMLGEVLDVASRRLGRVICRRVRDQPLLRNDPSRAVYQLTVEITTSFCAAQAQSFLRQIGRPILTVQSARKTKIAKSQDRWLFWQGDMLSDCSRWAEVSFLSMMGSG